MSDEDVADVAAGIEVIAGSDFELRVRVRECRNGIPFHIGRVFVQLICCGQNGLPFLLGERLDFVE